MPAQQSGNGGTELGRFLRALRVQTTPAEVGLPQRPGARRTPGLRREELAFLAGVSVDYYARLERGQESRPGPSVVDALARALRLDEAEHEHLQELVLRAAGHVTATRTPAGRAVSAGVLMLLESLRPHPVHVVNRGNDLLAANPGGLSILAGLDSWPAEQRNIARYVFLHPAAREVFANWDEQARASVGYLRALAGTEPDAPDLISIVGELLLKSLEFARLWERYDVRGVPGSSRKTFRHPQIGTFTLGYQLMQVVDVPGQYMVTYYTEPGTPDHDAMIRLDRLVSESEHAAEPAAPGR